MKTYRPIADGKRTRAICAALNKLLYKFPMIPPDRKHKSLNDQGAYVVAELADRDIKITWSKKNQCFRPSRRKV